MSDRSLAALSACLDRVYEIQDPSPVLAPGMLDHARKLAARADEGSLDLELLHVLGWFHYYRLLALNGTEDDEDFQTAVSAHAVCLVHGVGPLPDDLLPYIAVDAAELATELLEQPPTGDVTPMTHLAVDAWRRILQVSPPGDPLRPISFAGLALALDGRFSLTGESADLDELIDAGGQAAAGMDDDHPSLVLVLPVLRRALDERLSRIGEASDLDAVIEVGRRAVAVLPPDRPERVTIMLAHCDALRTRFTRDGDGGDLDEAISVIRRAAPDDPLRRGLSLAILGSMLMQRCLPDGDITDLDEAITAMRQAVDTLPADHPVRARALYGLGLAFYAWFARTEDGRYADEGIEVDRQMAALPSGDPDHREQASERLSSALLSRFVRTGNREDLHEAIKTGRQALAAYGLDRVVVAPRLAYALMLRSYLSGDGADLDEAISLARQAVDAAPAGHPNLGFALSSLSGTLDSRFARTDDMADVDEAINAMRRAVNAYPVGHVGRAVWLSSLSSMLQDRAGWTGESADLDEAIATARQATAALPVDHPSRKSVYSNLSSALEERFDLIGDPADLDEAVSAGEQAVAAASAEHFAWPWDLYQLGDALRKRYAHTRDSADLDRARALAHDAEAMAKPPLPTMVILVKRLQGRCALLAGDVAEAVAAFEAAVDLLPGLIPGRMARRDREHQIRFMGELGAEAAACAVAAGRPSRALELLEQTRGILAGEVRGIDSGAERLRAQAPEFLSEFDRMRAEYDLLEQWPADTMPITGITGTAAMTTLDDERRRRLDTERARLAAEWDGLIARVRTRPGLADFLRPPRVTDLRTAAVGGPIVTISVTEDFGGLALALGGDAGDPVRSIPLGGLTKPEAVLHSYRMQTANRILAGRDTTAEARDHARSDLLEVLDWLWRCVAEPVLNTLDAAGLLGPRIWWCPVGVMTHLPLHAAGTVMDRVISSYIPTVRALSGESRRPADPGGAALAVAMSTTPGAGALPGAAEEAREMSDLVAGTVLLADEQATRANVLARLPHCAVAHFACHATGNWGDPARGRLLLHDHLTAPLTVAELSRLRLTGAELAYLSACATSDTDPRLQDEAVHITGAFQLAGFQQVIGSLWSVDDLVSAVVASDVYGFLTREGTIPPQTARAAEALHVAVHRVRDRYRDRPELWAAYIHVGR